MTEKKRHEFLAYTQFKAEDRTPEIFDCLTIPRGIDEDLVLRVGDRVRLRGGFGRPIGNALRVASLSSDGVEVRDELTGRQKMFRIRDFSAFYIEKVEENMSPKVLTFDEIEVGMHLHASGIETPGNWDFVVREKGNVSATVELIEGPGFTVFSRETVQAMQFIQIEETPATDPPYPLSLLRKVEDSLDTYDWDPRVAGNEELRETLQKVKEYLTSQAPKVHKV